uniref:(northern house mosquito) hypothetical protein n=1 Tax=Culex pipiens TaxID=7175 RepID=A0A8D8EZC7_CULPI
MLLAYQPATESSHRDQRASASTLALSESPLPFTQMELIVACCPGISRPCPMSRRTGSAATATLPGGFNFDTPKTNHRTDDEGRSGSTGSREPTEKEKLL